MAENSTAPTDNQQVRSTVMPQNLYNSDPTAKMQLQGVNKDIVLRYPDGIGGATDGKSNVPFVIFAPYTRTSDAKNLGSLVEGAVAGVGAAVLAGGVATYTGADRPTAAATAFASGATAGLLTTAIKMPDSKEYFYGAMPLDQLPAPVFHIVLPLPADALSTKYNVKYEQYDLGLYASMLTNKSAGLGLAGVVAGAAAGAMLNPSDSSSRIKQAITGAALGGTGLGLATNLQFTGTSMIQGGLSAVDENLSKAITAGYIQRQTNPFTENIFKNVEMRTHTFTYNFVPRSLDESKLIDKIIQTFKFYMLPGVAPVMGDAGTLTDSLLTFPYEFQIYSSVQDTTFSMMPSILESVGVEYGKTDAGPSFFRPQNNGERYPTQVSLTLSFKEVIILTRQKIGAETQVRNSDVQVMVNGQPGYAGVNKYRF